MPPSLVLDTYEKVRKLRRAVDSDDETAVLASCVALLEQPLGEALQVCVYTWYADALVHQEQWERLLQLVTDKKKLDPTVQAALQPWHMYALYRLAQYAQAQSMAATQQNNKDSPEASLFERHLIAQCHYRQCHIPDAQQAYAALLAQNPRDASVATNLVATFVVNATPLVAESLPHIQHLVDLVHNNHGDEYPLDLVYNLATHHVLAAQHGFSAANWQQILRKAAATNNAQELALIQMNAQWTRKLWQGSTGDELNVSMKDLPASGKLVALCNRALDMKNPADALRLLPTDTSKLSPLQGRLVLYNKAILQYKAEQWDECMESCKLLQNSLTNKDKCPPNSKAQALWWESRHTVLMVRAQSKKGGKYNKNTSEQTCQQLLQTLQKQQPPSAMIDEAIAYVQVHLASLGEDCLRTPQDQLALLQSLPWSIQTTPAVVATMAALYQQTGHADQALKLVQESGYPDVLADLMLSQGQYSQAIALYKEAAAASKGPVHEALYARALTFLDPREALEYWNKIRPHLDELDRDSNAIVEDGAQLETRPVPRLRRKTSVLTTTTTADTNSGDVVLATTPQTKKKKSHESVLRRRAAQREAYLTELDKRGLKRTSHPDPERWLPKYERSYNRRRRGNKNVHHKSSQGGVSDKDAAALDVAARQAARASGEASATTSTSTAHMTAVSAGGPARKGGRRR